MPHYYFSLADGHYDPDHEGVTLVDDSSARAVAVKYAGEMLRSEPALLLEDGQFRVEVTDADGSLLFIVVTVAIKAARPRSGEHGRPSDRGPPGAGSSR